MIDWVARVAELKHMADEMDSLASRSDGRIKLTMGRIADELRQFANLIDKELNPPGDIAPSEMPTWLTENLDPALFNSELPATEEAGAGIEGYWEERQWQSEEAGTEMDDPLWPTDGDSQEDDQ
jgi:hypothetical protein